MVYRNKIVVVMYKSCAQNCQKKHLPTPLEAVNFIIYICICVVSQNLRLQYKPQTYGNDYVGNTTTAPPARPPPPPPPLTNQQNMINIVERTLVSCVASIKMSKVDPSILSMKISPSEFLLKWANVKVLTF
ncbi:unnamed protein product [Ceratitis capitata]|uniref:(Mediterranean fruit fly) hypothetical protein n=1 Tax=Ceratitis capitata TaxID=7213 RepID=A0A811UZA4_CERCA|nr:unnamed protein product [Ceratitis capitata]